MPTNGINDKNGTRSYSCNDRTAHPETSSLTGWHTCTKKSEVLFMTLKPTKHWRDLKRSLAWSQSLSHKIIKNLRECLGGWACRVLKMTPCYVFNNIMLCLIHCANRIMDTHQWVRPGIGETERTPPSNNGSQRAASLRKILISCGRKNIILYKINTVVSNSNTSRPMYKPTKFCVYKISCIHRCFKSIRFLTSMETRQPSLPTSDFPRSSCSEREARKCWHQLYW